MLYWPWNASNAGSWPLSRRRARLACPADLRLLAVPGQDQGVGGPLGGPPRLLGRVPDLPLGQHLEGVVVERPPVGEEEVHPFSGYHVATSTDHQSLRPQGGRLPGQPETTPWASRTRSSCRTENTGRRR